MAHNFNPQLKVTLNTDLLSHSLHHNYCISAKDNMLIFD